MTDSLGNLLSRGLLAELILYSFIYLIIGAFWSLFLSIFYPTLAGNTAFTQSLTFIEFLISSLTTAEIYAQMNGFTTKLSSFKGFLNSVDSFANTLNTIQLTQNADIIAIKDHVTKFVIFVYMRLNPIDGTQLLQNYKIILKSTNHDPPGEYNYLYDQIHDIKLRYNNLQRTESAQLDRHILELETYRNNLIISNIRDPIIFKQFIYVLLSLFYFIWLPIITWVRFGGILGPILYTIWMITLSTTFIFKNWLGDPFSPKRFIISENHSVWVSDTLVKLNGF